MPNIIHLVVSVLGFSPRLVGHQSLSIWSTPHCPEKVNILPKVTQHTVVQPRQDEESSCFLQFCLLCSSPLCAWNPYKAPGKDRMQELGARVSLIPCTPRQWSRDFPDWIQFPARADMCQAFSSDKPRWAMCGGHGGG